jgi:hypothetical protein
MKKMKKTKSCGKGLKGCGKYFAHSFREFIESFKNLDKRFFRIALFDALFLISVLVVVIAFSSFIGTAKQGFLPDISGDVSMIAVYALSGALVMLAIWAAFTFLGISACQALFKGLIWTTVMSKKFTKRYFWKMFGLNLVWFLLWMIPSLIIYYGLNPDYKSVIQPLYFLVIFHFTTLLYIIFTRKNAIKRSIKLALSIGTRKIKYFILPYIFAAIIYVVLGQLYNYVDPGAKLGMVTAVVVTLFLIAWLRLYIYSIVEHHL